MEAAENILAQPLYLCLFILHQLQTTFSVVNDGFMGRRPIEVAVVGHLVGWLVLAIIAATVVFWAIKYVLENAFASAGSLKDIWAGINSVLWRLIIILVIYAVLSLLVYAFANLSHMVLNEMNYVPPATKII